MERGEVYEIDIEDSRCLKERENICFIQTSGLYASCFRLLLK